VDATFPDPTQYALVRNSAKSSFYGFHYSLIVAAKPVVICLVDPANGFGFVN
jgi:hypothetical protein